MEQKQINTPKFPGKAFILIFACILAAVGLIAYLWFSRSGAARLAEYIDLGERYLEELNYEEAVVAFQKAVGIDPKNKEASSGLARAYEGAEQYEQAEAVYLDMTERFPSDGIFYKDLAELYVRLERLEDAKRLLEEAVSRTEDEAVQELYERTSPKAPVFSLAAGTYDTWQAVEISVEHGEEVIFYSLDGSEPDENSLIYQEPVILPSGTTVLQAKAVNSMGYVSEIASAEYHISQRREEIEFSDPVMESLVRQKLGIWSGPLYNEDVAMITSLRAVGREGESEEGNHLSATTFTESGYQIYGNVMSDTGDLSTLADLVYMPFLTELELTYQNHLSLDGIASCSRLSSLSLLHNDLNSIEPLQGLISLERLSLGWNRIRDLSPISGLTNLTSLSFWENQVSSLEPLSGLTELRYLDLSGNAVSDLSPLAGLSKLEELWMYENHVSDLTPLTGLMNLQVLMMRGNDLNDLSVFRTIFPKLTRTDILLRKGGEG